MKALHTQLRERRRAMHLTQLQAARLAGISRRRYAGIERGESTTLETLHDVAAVLGCSVTVTLKIRKSDCIDLSAQPKKNIFQKT